MSNLCQEITLPTYPLTHIDDELGEIALCILSAVNVGTIRNDKELEDLCDLSVRGLEELIDYQEYPVLAAEVATKARRSLGVGFIGLAHYLAKLGFKYDSQEAWDAVHGLAESFQYYLLKSSNFSLAVIFFLVNLLAGTLYASSVLGRSIPSCMGLKKKG